jgi:hypothetical protein
VLGRVDGTEVGARLFEFEGNKVGLDEGTAVEAPEGIDDGPIVGPWLGLLELLLTDGAELGGVESSAVLGRLDGTALGTWLVEFVVKFTPKLPWFKLVWSTLRSFKMFALPFICKL